MPSRVVWSADGETALDAKLALANGRRRARLLTMAQVKTCVTEALTAPHRYAWLHGGVVDDGREVTTLALAVATAEHVAVGIHPVRANRATPGAGWPELADWDAYAPSANIAMSQTWARRPHENSVRLPVEAPPVVHGSTADLHNAILEAPDDLHLRRVYADALQEQGDPRGEFIAIQLALSETSSAAPALRARERELLEAHGRDWLAPFTPDQLTVEFRRGFAHTVTVHSAAQLLMHQAFFEREPVRTLQLSSTQYLDMPALANAPWVSRLEALRFEGQGYGVDRLHAEQVHALLESRFLRRVHTLEFVGHRVDNMGLLVLAKNGHAVLPSLTSLTIAHDEISELGVQGLMSTRLHAQLTHLNLSHNVLRSGGAEALALTRAPGRLHTLTLDHTWLGNDGARALAAGPRFESLRTLSLEANDLRDVGVEALLSSPFLRGLTALNLRGNPMGARSRPLYARRFG